MKLNYQIFGNGSKTIVLFHYFGGKADSWEWVVKRLKKKFRIMAITLPGFGNSEPLEEPSIYHFSTYINDCIAESEVTNYILCGHSMSGKLILYATQLNAGNCRKDLY